MKFLEVSYQAACSAKPGATAPLTRQCSTLARWARLIVTLRSRRAKATELFCASRGLIPASDSHLMHSGEGSRKPCLSRDEQAITAIVRIARPLYSSRRAARHRFAPWCLVEQVSLLSQLPATRAARPPLAGSSLSLNSTLACGAARSSATRKERLSDAARRAHKSHVPPKNKQPCPSTTSSSGSS